MINTLKLSLYTHKEAWIEANHTVKRNEGRRSSKQIAITKIRGGEIVVFIYSSPGTHKTFDVYMDVIKTLLGGLLNV